MLLQELPAHAVEIVEEDHTVVGEIVQALAVEHDGLGEPRHRLLDREELVELLVIFEKQEAAVGIVDEIFELLGRVRRVDARRYPADRLHAEIGVDPLLVVFRQDRDDLAALQAERQEAEADEPRMLVEIGPGIGEPDAVILLAMRDLGAVGVAALAEQLGQRVAAIEEIRSLRQILVEAVPEMHTLGRNFSGNGHA